MASTRTCGEQAMLVKEHIEDLNADSMKLVQRLMAASGVDLTDLSGVDNLTDEQTLLIRDAIKLLNQSIRVCNESLDLSLAEAQKLDRILTVVEVIDKNVRTTKK